MTDESAISPASDADRLATATFGMGSFWDAEPVFGAIDGVVRTRVGFAGGVETDPTYLDPKDHVEAVQVEYDPDSLAFPDLVEAFWSAHDPTEQPDSPRYRRTVFWHEAPQRRALEAALAAVDAADTAVEPFVEFDLAAPGHQKYRLRQHDDLTAKLRQWRDVDIRESPLATKLNGYVVGHGTRESFAAALDELGVEGIPRKRLLRRVHGSA